MTVLQGTISIQTDDTLVKVHTTGSASGDGAIALQFSILREIYDPASEGELSIQLQLGADNVNFDDVGDPISIGFSDPDSTMNTVSAPSALYFRFVITFSSSEPASIVFRFAARAIMPPPPPTVSGDPLVFGLLGSFARNKKP